MKKIKAPNYTQLPNCILDNLSHYSESELRVLLAICRQTFGWHRESHKMTITFLQRATGLSHVGVRKGVESLVKSGIVNRVGKSGTRGGMTYQIIMEDECECETELRTEQNECEAKLSIEGPGVRSAVSTNKERLERNTSKEVSASALVHSEPEAGEDEPIDFEAVERELKANERSNELQVHPTRDFISAWARQYKAFWERPYRVYNGDKGKDAGAALRLQDSDEFTLEDNLQLAVRAWRKARDGDPKETFWCQRAKTISGFVAGFNEIVAELERPEPRKQKTLFEKCQDELLARA